MAEANERGLVQIYTGDGKGKTTAALGLAWRAAGWGRRSFIGQFMKGQETGERRAASLLAPLITVEQFGQPRLLRMNEVSPQNVEMVQNGLRRVAEILDRGEYHLVVLDEICVALHFRLATVEQVLALIDRRPPQVEMVLTGRRAPQALLDRADLVTEMVEVKHPYRQGIAARRGIEF
ncbi:MAG TPA: cob(I)yrinic acid a,c-diamide adenosyltransferase [Chloroflexi bacterium]|jgi:cob(I)alamin adenosyltransferase|nr:cob(I)yrinic acid a,c-diamide adenosyltransferase [Chloroflexota bacterium]